MNLKEFFRPRVVIPLFMILIAVMLGIKLSQQTKMDRIAEEKAQLTSEYAALEVEQERLERMLEYMQTDDYLMQYAREKLGYVFPNDIKFRD